MRNFVHLNQVRTTTDQMPALVFQHLICGGVQQDFEKFVNAGKRTGIFWFFTYFLNHFVLKITAASKEAFFVPKISYQSIV
jgi:hypothetical protein